MAWRDGLLCSRDKPIVKPGWGLGCWIDWGLGEWSGAREESFFGEGLKGKDEDPEWEVNLPFEGGTIEVTSLKPRVLLF